VDLATVTVDTFAPHVGDVFALADGTAYELVSAVATGPGGVGGGRAPFTLEFAGPPGVVRPQAIETLSHGGLGTLEVFLVPIGQDASAVRYQAVFT
jgi:hypothetical protein